MQIDRYAKTLSKREKTEVQTLADCDMNIAWTARILGTRRNTLQYHFDSIMRKTGLDPLNFYNLHELLYLESE